MPFTQTVAEHINAICMFRLKVGDSGSFSRRENTELTLFSFHHSCPHLSKHTRVCDGLSLWVV